MMESQTNEFKLTVQGVNNPVPAAEGGGNAGPRSSISSDCINTNTNRNTKNNIGENVTHNDNPLCASMSMADVHIANPFGRSSAIKRTPPSGNSVLNVQQPKDIAQSTVNPQEIPINHSDTFTDLGKLIVDLMEYVKSRNNVHHAIKDKVRIIRITYNKIRDERISVGNDTHKIPDGAYGNNSAIERETQTSPQVWPTKRDAKRDRDVSEETPKSTAPKRQKRASRKMNKAKKVEVENTASDIASTQREQPPENIWQTVKKTRKKSFKKPKPDVMIISTKGEASYADILRRLKTDPELNSLGEEVNKIRRTQKGDLLIELKTTGGNVAERFNDKLVTSLNGCADVKTLKEETVIECKDLDDITTKSEICRALAHELNLPALEERIVKSLRKTPMGTQTAKISLPAVDARKALEMRKIKIGWSVCRLIETVTVTKCFKCLDYGHISKFCKSEYDRSNHCRKCGVEGHFAKNCLSEANCMLCKSRGADDTRHVTGSYRCPVFRQALSHKSK